KETGVSAFTGPENQRPVPLQRAVHRDGSWPADFSAYQTWHRGHCLRDYPATLFSYRKTSSSRFIRPAVQPANIDPPNKKPATFVTGFPHFSQTSAEI
ncbi:hypothetical protein, partial [Paraburkholderia sp. J12]|uniref:hypothetical protein n=1 Tax=Paraburkholderia sp. J12 TaxID=2805432 RepID=UPI002ABD6B5B